MQQTQTAVQQRKRNLQDYLLSKLRRSRALPRVPAPPDEAGGRGEIEKG